MVFPACIIMTEDNKHKPKPAPSEGNASNPAPGSRDDAPPKPTQFGEKAEKLFKESGNIEDLPDAEEDQEAIDRMEKE